MEISMRVSGLMVTIIIIYSLEKIKFTLTGKLEGQGKLFNENGQYYEGQFKNGKNFNKILNSIYFILTSKINLMDLGSMYFLMDRSMKDIL